jgi:hypothetical protein
LYRALAGLIYAYAGLSAAQWGHAEKWLQTPHVGFFWCGNVLSDSYLFVVNYVCPLAAACAGAIAIRCLKTRRWPWFAITALLTFIATSACLAYEGYWLRNDHAINVLNGILWLPLRYRF